MTGLHRISQFIAPDVCPVCRGNRPANNDGLCEDCTGVFRELNIPRCNTCGGALDGALDLCSECLRREERPWLHAVSVFPFKATVRTVIHRFKYNGQPWLARFFGYRMAQNWLQYGPPVVEGAALVPVPLHPWKQWRRGYNQAHLLAAEVGLHLNLPVVQPLRRYRWSKSQAGLGYMERQKNVQGLFSCKGSVQFGQRHIVVIDDVLTTGATLEAAVTTVKEWNPGAEVNILTAARG